MEISNDPQYYNGQDDDDVSDELFTFEGYTTRVLAYQLADAISLRSNNPERVAFLDAFNSGESAWVRGNICRALSAHGVTLSSIHRRKS